MARNRPTVLSVVSWASLALGITWLLWLAVGRGEDALDLLRTHQARFPHGRLSEEREVLTIRALASEGRTADAAERARRFEQMYPDSLFVPAVRAVTAGAR